MVNRQIERKGRKLVSMFIDLKVAFDSVDREVLMRTIRGRGVRKELVVRVREIYAETRNRVRVGGEMGEKFWTAGGGGDRVAR